MGGKMGLQKVILEGKLAPYPWRIFGKNPAETERKQNSTQSEKTEKREYERLLEIRDNYPKYVLRTDEFAGGNYQGIKSMHIADFLLSTEY